MTTRALIAVEARRFFSSSWNLRLALLIVPAIWLALLEHTPSPFVPIFAALFIGLEPQYCNILYRAPNEFEALSVLPVRWARIVLAKNLATILLTIACLPIVSVLVLYFSPDAIPAGQFSRAALYLGSMIFPLLHAGNLQSLLQPRRHLGWQVNDLAGAVVMAGFVAVLSIPYLVLVEAAESPLLCLLYTGAAGWYWARHSLAETARRIIQSTSSLCETR